MKIIELPGYDLTYPLTVYDEINRVEAYEVDYNHIVLQTLKYPGIVKVHLDVLQSSSGTVSLLVYNKTKKTSVICYRVAEFQEKECVFAIGSGPDELQLLLYPAVASQTKGQSAVVKTKIEQIFSRTKDYNEVKKVLESKKHEQEQLRSVRQAFQYSVYLLNQKGCSVFLFENVRYDSVKFKYSQAVLDRVKKRITYFDMINDIDKYEDDLKVIFQERYSREYLGKLRHYVRTIKADNRYCREDYKSEYINFLGGRRVTCFQPKEYDKTIHIYGRCAVEGGPWLEDRDTLPSQIQMLLNKNGYGNIRVENHGLTAAEPYFQQIMNNFIRDSVSYNENDIIVFYDDQFTLATLLNPLGIDEIDLYNECPVNDIMSDQLIDSPSHANFNVYRIYAEMVYKHLAGNGFSNKVQMKEPDSGAAPMLNYLKKSIGDDVAASVGKYVENILKEYPHTEEIKKCGAIVMNCNPFTKGHRKLIEYAAKRVDRLYIFCVEENTSYFSFDDRISMIKMGTKDIKNVVVVPSGEFIISVDTFPEYFLKENIRDEIIDVSQDVSVFCKYIAPPLGISVRFAGEEPNDPITKQYNDKMKELLPGYGIEFLEIPRFTLYGGEVISATKVRELIKQGNNTELKKYVPKTTYNIIIDKYFPHK